MRDKIFNTLKLEKTIIKNNTLWLIFCFVFLLIFKVLSIHHFYMILIRQWHRLIHISSNFRNVIRIQLPECICWNCYSIRDIRKQKNSCNTIMDEQYFFLKMFLLVPLFSSPGVYWILSAAQGIILLTKLCKTTWRIFVLYVKLSITYN